MYENGFYVLLYMIIVGILRGEGGGVNQYYAIFATFNQNINSYHVFLHLTFHEHITIRSTIQQYIIQSAQ
jgi:hypothetical protein